MQQAKAITKYVRISPRKARLAAGLIREADVELAMQTLAFSPMKGSTLLRKTLKSAIANAETNLGIQRRDLVVKEVRVDEGPTMKRAKSKSKGGRVPVMKRMSHFTVVVGAK